MEPKNQSSYSFEDTIEVVAQVTKRNGNVNVAVQDGKDIINLGSEKTDDSNGEVRFEIYLDDPYLSNGEYSIRVSAYNEGNKSSEYVSIQYSELKRQRLGIAALSGQSSSKQLQVKLENGNTYNQSLNGDYPYLAVNNRIGVITVAPSTSGQLQGFDQQLSNLFQVPNPNVAGNIQYRYLEEDQGFIYSFEQEGFIRAWQNNSSSVRNYELANERIPLTAAFGEPGVLVGAKERGKENYEVMLLNPQNGALLKKSSVSGYIHSVAYLGNSTFAVVTNMAGNTNIYTLEAISNTLTPFATISSEVPLSLESLEDGNVLLSTDQKIYICNPLQSVLPNQLHNFTARDIEYDRSSGDVFYASGNNVMNGVIGGTLYMYYSSSSPVEQIELIFNK